MKKILKILSWTGIVILILFIAFLALGVWELNRREKTRVAIEKINSTKINLGDVMGENLPPEPDQKLNDSTIAGIDANNNYIRDDVELAIFKKYPNSAKIRAAMLQYAQALQLELTEVFNSKNYIAAIKKEDSAGLCIVKTVNKDEGFNIVAERNKEVDSLVLNIDLREKKESDNLKYMTTYSSSKEDCDIDLLSLPN